MLHAIIRGANGRRHEVEFGDAPVRVEIYASEETVEIFIEPDFETLAEERRRFALLNVLRHLFGEPTAVRRAKSFNFAQGITTSWAAPYPDDGSAPPRNPAMSSG
jgi:hypothetical protein